MIASVQRCFFLIIMALALLISLLVWQMWMNTSSLSVQFLRDFAGMQGYITLPQYGGIVCPPPPVDC